jgi:hypothetical protein
MTHPRTFSHNTKKPQTMNTTIETKVKNWYNENYPTDNLGENINPLISFYDVFYTLDNYGDIYELIGESDSLIRERIFEKLCELTGHTYEEIYDQWAKAY